MATLSDFREAVSQWMRENVLHPDTGNFFQSRITRTPGMVTPLSNASGTYTPTDNPAAIVQTSTLNKNLRDALSGEWQNQPNGFIRVDPSRVNSKVLGHEQIHDVFTKGDLAKNAFDIAPLLDQGWKNYVSNSPAYAFNDFPERMNETLAYQLSSGPEEKYLPAQDRLSGKIAAILNSKGKSEQAKQIVKLVGK